MGFHRQEYWSGLPFPPPGDLPDPGMEPISPALAGRFLTSKPPGKPQVGTRIIKQDRVRLTKSNFVLYFTFLPISNLDFKMQHFLCLNYHNNACSFITDYK